ncbi:MAG: 2'-5' RNA ligase family protein [Erysipelotrichaceae bacterium]|nr:2'-5' RNA ligase family protein [Erysipelotrichaceae bacterium]MBO4537584.1 2'-5' RNA ligase family protein [Erysipelotrichaceae bacterium]MBR5048568.1 2'-5' RNA ligase family protein [Erysipelotrichaceae bacterium]
MSEQFLTLMADLDEESQKLMAGWYASLKEAGFTGSQSPEVPYHISLMTFASDQQARALETMYEAAEQFAPIPVYVSHIGVFAGGRVLFAAPESNPQLEKLRAACGPQAPQMYPWIPHITLLMDETENVCAALSVLVKSFRPFLGWITRLQVCSFWPMQEIAAIDLIEEAPAEN